MEPVARYFLGTRSLVGFRLMETDGGFVIDQYARLINVLTKRCGGQVAGLFAEPHISYGNGKAPARIDWYTRYDGIARPMTELDPSSALAVQRTLSSRLAALRPLSFDPEYGPLVAAALNIADPNAMLSVGGDPVLIDWGMLPQTALASERQRGQHFSSTLGPYLPDFGLPPLTGEEWARSFAPGQSAETQARPRGTAEPASEPLAGPPRTDRGGLAAPGFGPSIVAPAVAASLAALLLGTSWIPGVLAFPNDASAAPAAAMATGREVVRQLEIQRRKLDEAMVATCPALIHANATDPVVPPRLDNVQVTVPPAAAAAGGPPAPPSPPSTFPARVNEGTVLVIASRGSGSGFFVAPDLIVTNQHVVDNDRRVRVASSAIGIVEAEVVGSAKDEVQDFALLKVAPQAKAKPFEIAAIPPPLQQVVAVGYPGVAMGTDQAYRRVMQGDAAASRELVAIETQGSVNALQPRSGGLTLVVHSADISHGNSGGPLVDLCGSVVGINTLGLHDESMMWKYALGSDGIKAFVARLGGTTRSADHACPPTVASAESPPASTATPPSPPATAAPQPAVVRTPSAPAPGAPAAGSTPPASR